MVEERCAGWAWHGIGTSMSAYGWEFPSNAERYALLEDALRLLPLLWGAGAHFVRGPCG